MCKMQNLMGCSVGLIRKVNGEQSHKVGETVKSKKGKSLMLSTYMALLRNRTEISVSTLSSIFLTPLYCNNFILRLFEN